MSFSIRMLVAAWRGDPEVDPRPQDDLETVTMTTVAQNAARLNPRKLKRRGMWLIW